MKSLKKQHRLIKRCMDQGCTDASLQALINADVDMPDLKDLTTKLPVERHRLLGYSLEAVEERIEQKYATLALFVKDLINGNERYNYNAVSPLVEKAKFDVLFGKCKHITEYGTRIQQKPQLVQIRGNLSMFLDTSLPDLLTDFYQVLKLSRTMIQIASDVSVKDTDKVYRKLRALRDKTKVIGDGRFLYDGAYINIQYRGNDLAMESMLGPGYIPPKGKPPELGLHSPEMVLASTKHVDKVLTMLKDSGMNQMVYKYNNLVSQTVDKPTLSIKPSAFNDIQKHVVFAQNRFTSIAIKMAALADYFEASVDFYESLGD